MKKIFMTLILAILILSVFNGCSITPKLDKEKIKNDIITKDNITDFGREITDFTIIKRQTNVENKEDIVYVSFVGENDDYSFVWNYKATYILYNEGWHLEELEKYSDDIYENYVIPKHGVPTTEIQNDYLKTTDFVGSFEPDYFYTSTSEIKEISEPQLEKNFGMHCFSYDVIYEYDTVIETVTIPIIYYFKEIEGEWNWSVSYTSPYEYQHDVKFNKSIAGRWVNNFTNAKRKIELLITNVQDYTIDVSYTSTYIGKKWSMMLTNTDTEEYNGRMNLIYNPSDSSPVGYIHIVPENESTITELSVHYSYSNYFRIVESSVSYTLGQVEKY